MVSATSGATVSTYQYDVDNRLTSRTDGAGADSYTYDGLGVLLKETKPGGAWTAHVGAAYEVRSDGSVTKYYQAMGTTIAVRQTGVLMDLLSDHLGSTVGLMDASGAVIARSVTKYWPYGATRSGSISPTSGTDRLFTGQQVQPNDPTVMGL